MPGRDLFSANNLSFKKGRYQSIMHVYVINKHGEPLMPCKPRKARVLLQSKKAVVVKKEPFTIQLLYGSSGYKQPVSLGIDAGSKHVGIAATTEKEVLYAEELQPRNDVVKLLSKRRSLRSARRNRKTRYRKKRFDNRVRSKHKDWLAPSVEVKIQEHISAIEHIQKILPVTEVHVETAEFDTQRLKAMVEGKPLPVGTDYQLGEMYDTYNTRQYVLKRDNYTCQCCKAHGKGVKLHVHHKESRQTGGNAPNNLITLCEDCHKKIHRGELTLNKKKSKRGKPLKDATFMGIMRKTLISRLRTRLNIPVHETMGYITKMRRELYHIQKTHVNDAIVISKNYQAVFDGNYYYSKAIRHHNRKIHKEKFLKEHIKKRNQAPYVVKGFKLFDTVEYQEKLYFVLGRRSDGFMDIRTLDGTKVNNGSISRKKLKFVQSNTGVMLERRKAIPPKPEGLGFHV